MKGSKQERITGIEPDGDFCMLHSRKAVEFGSHTICVQALDGRACKPEALDGITIVCREKNMEVARVPPQPLPAVLLIQWLEKVEIDPGWDDTHLLLGQIFRKVFDEVPRHHDHTRHVPGGP